MEGWRGGASMLEAEARESKAARARRRRGGRRGGEGRGGGASAAALQAEMDGDEAATRRRSGR